GAAPAVRAEGGGGVRVTVVAILASEHNTDADPKLKEPADEVHKQRKDWTGFRLATMASKMMQTGDSNTFPLVDKQAALVGVEQVPDKEHVTLKVKPPDLTGEIVYTTLCGKYFPILTRYQTKEGDHLIVAIMAKTGKDK